jgi:hypothetical protein
MLRIKEVKYLRVRLKVPSNDELTERFPDIWVMSGSYCIKKDRTCNISSEKQRHNLALDDAYAEMEEKVNRHLEMGWALNGCVVWNYVKSHSCVSSSYVGDELFQTMVKYES